MRLNLTITYSVIPDLIGNPWLNFSSMWIGQVMDSRVRGNDDAFGGGVAL
jgi:hypothetical protein